jgi:hypothetical protein
MDNVMLARSRSRRPDRWARTRAGIVIPQHATLRGELHWRVLDERGVPEVPRNPSGFAIASADGVKQPNLITNQFLDEVPVYSIKSVSTTAGISSRRFLAVGTGSTAPAFTDTALVNQVQQAASSGVYSAGSSAYSLDTDINVLRGTFITNRVVVMDADRNLAEFGYRQNTSTDLVIRELFRDSVGDPTTISLLNGKTLYVVHTLIADIAAPKAGTTGQIDFEEYDAGNNLVDTTPIDIVYGWHTNTTVSFVDFDHWDPVSATSHAVPRILNDLRPFDRDGALGTNGDHAQAGSWSSLGQDAYVAGTHSRGRNAVIAAGVGTGDWYGFKFRPETYTNPHTRGFAVLFDGPTFITKSANDELTLRVVSTWARA